MDKELTDKLLERISDYEIEGATKLCQALGFESIEAFFNIGEETSVKESEIAADSLGEAVVKNEAFSNLQRKIEGLNTTAITENDIRSLNTVLNNFVSLLMEQKMDDETKSFLTAFKDEFKSILERRITDFEKLRTTMPADPISYMESALEKTQLENRIQTDLAKIDIVSHFEVLWTTPNEQGNTILSEQEVMDFLTANFHGFDEVKTKKILHPKIDNPNHITRLFYEFYKNKDLRGNALGQAKRYCKMMTQNFSIYSGTTPESLAKNWKRISTGILNGSYLFR